MPKQLTLSAQADANFEAHRKATRRDVFLSEMDQVVPWAELCAVIEPFYPKARERGGRRPVGLERMLRIHFLQQWYALSDPAVEEALYDSAAMRPHSLPALTSRTHFPHSLPALTPHSLVGFRLCEPAQRRSAWPFLTGSRSNYHGG